MEVQAENKVKNYEFTHSHVDYAHLNAVLLITNNISTINLRQ